MVMKANRLPSTDKSTIDDRTAPPQGPKSAWPAWAANVSPEPTASRGTSSRNAPLTAT